MIIVSQDKEIIVNFNNVESIDIVADLDGTGKVPYKIYYETDSKREELGTYKTEERAREVLQEIANKYLEYASIQNGVGNISSITILPRAYEMPKE